MSTPAIRPDAPDPWEGMTDYQKMQTDYGRYASERGIAGYGNQPAGAEQARLDALAERGNLGAYQGGQAGGGIPLTGGGSLPGGGNMAMLEYGAAAGAEQYLPDIIGLAGRETSAIEAGAQGLPYGPDAYAPDLMQYGLERQITAPGMTDAEYNQAKRRVTEGFGAATGKISANLGKAGYFDKESVAQAAGGAPAQQLGHGFAEIEAKNAEIQRREREAGIRTLASQYGTMSGRAYGPYDAYQSRVGQYQTQTPVQEHGISTTKPSSTAPGTYSSLPSSGSYRSGNLNFQHRFG